MPAPAWRRRAKIVATLGPSTDGIEGALIDAGLNVARLNFSHGSQADHARRCGAIRAAAAARGVWVAVLQDLQGPKIRVGKLVGGGPVRLVEGQPLTITTDEIVGDARRVGCTYAGLPHDVHPGDRLYLDDGRIRLRVVAIDGSEVATEIEDGGPLGEHKGINLPGIAVSAPALTDKDRADLRFGLLELAVDFVALSFIRSADEVEQARALVRAYQRDTPLIAKLEKAEAIDDLEAILNAADGVMVARGDLGVETTPERVPMLQKRIIQLANQRGIPVITATQMLESMVHDETPTRAEATDVANAVWDGTDALMLSAETAAGEHPILALAMMDRIVRSAESATDGPVADARAIDRRVAHRREDDIAAAATHAARVLARDLAACAIVGITRTGRTAQLLACGRAAVPVFAFSPDERVCQRLALWWGITAVHHRLADSLDANIAAMEAFLLAAGEAAAGETVVVAGAYPFRAGVHTNFVKLHQIGAADPGDQPDARPMSI